MEYKDLTAFVLLLILVGMLVGVAVITFDKFGIATYESRSITADSFTVAAVGANITLDHTNITSFSSVTNVTGCAGTAWDTGNYTVYATAGKITVNDNSTPCLVGATCYACYTYTEHDVTTANTLESSRDAVAAISSTWMSLVITIGILSIIMGMVVAGFYLKKR